MSKKKNIILTAGGTGGHLFPAQAVADSLKDKCEILFVGGGLSKNKYFNQQKYPFVEIESATLSFKSPWTAFKAGIRILKGLFQSLKILSKVKPELVVGFGSFYTFPLLLAAKLKGIPILLHEQNSLPGKVNKLFASSALATAITFPETAALINGKSIQVAFPLRWNAEKIDRKIALNYFSLQENLSTLLVFGGSQGGSGLNRIFLELVPTLPKNIQVLHFTGNKEVKEQAQALYVQSGIPACVKEFETRMDLAWNLADLAITRAGAATIAELIAWEVPAILIPFPHATDSHQEKNGDHFVNFVKGGEMFLEGKNDSKEIKKMLEAYLSGEAIRKKEQIRKYKKENVCLTLHELILRY